MVQPTPPREYKVSSYSLEPGTVLTRLETDIDGVEYSVLGGGSVPVEDLRIQLEDHISATLDAPQQRKRDRRPPRTWVALSPSGKEIASGLLTSEG